MSTVITADMIPATIPNARLNKGNKMYFTTK